MFTVPSPSQPAVTDREFVDRVIAERQGHPGELLGILEAVQDRNPQKYLPAETLEYIAAKTDTPLAQVYSVASFYALFNLEPQGTHTICICRGTACHTRGSRTLLDRIRLEMGIEETDDEEGADKLVHTTPDGNFTLRTVACFGQCALAPVVEIDHGIFGHMNEQTLLREVEALEKKGDK